MTSRRRRPGLRGLPICVVAVSNRMVLTYNLLDFSSSSEPLLIHVLDACVETPLMRFVRGCPAADISSKCLLPRCKHRFGSVLPRTPHVPSSWFHTTSTAYSTSKPHILRHAASQGSHRFHDHRLSPKANLRPHSNGLFPDVTPPLEELHSPAAVPHHCSRYLPVVTAAKYAPSSLTRPSLTLCFLRSRTSNNTAILSPQVGSLHHSLAASTQLLTTLNTQTPKHPTTDCVETNTTAPEGTA